jgi:outer membrane protein assembly complex protein YaeT
LAQTAQFEGRVIADIQYTPAQPLAPQDLDRVQPLRKGSTLHAEDIAHAIDGLFSTGRFEDIAVEAEPSGAGVLVRFVIKLQWFVGGVNEKGRTQDPPKRAGIENAAQFTVGAPFQDQDVTDAVQSVTHLLDANGLYQTEVTPLVERDDNGQQVFVTFQIKEGKRAKYTTPEVQGETGLTDDTILRVTGWRVPIIHWWRQVADSRTHDGVGRLLKRYANDGRLKASVELTGLDYDPEQRRVSPHLQIDPGPRVEVTSVETKVSKRVLKRYVPVYQEGAVDNDLLQEGRRNLTDYFQSKGYYGVDVQFHQEQAQAGLEKIEYVISRGQRYRLAHLAFAGAKYFDTESIRERMFLAPATLFMRHGRYSEAFVRKDEESISNLYRANGFRDAKITATVQRDYRGKAGDIGVTIHIDEGPQWYVRHLEIAGPSAAHLAEWQPRIASSDGEPFSDVALAMDRENILEYYYTHGYPAASFKTEWKQIDGSNRVNLVYTIAEGDPQFVRGVLISGLHATRPSIVDKRITIQPGDPLSPLALTNIQKAFYDFGIFSRVDSAIQNQDGDTAYKNVLYHFEEADRYTFSVGVGAQVAKFGSPAPNSLGSPAGTTGFSPEVSLTGTRLNFLGLGHVVTARAAYSSIEKRGSLSYLQPRVWNKDGRNLTYTLLYDDTRDVRTFAAKREEGNGQLSQKFSRALTGLFGVAYRRVSLSNVVIPALLIPQLVQPVRIGMMTASLIQDRRDNPADPHRGVYNSAEFGLAGKFFGSQRGFGRVMLRNATYYSLTRSLVLARQTQFGVIEPFAPPPGLTAAESVPLPERFFSGGADSLRAFGYNEAGPRDTGAPLTPGGPSSSATGFPLGGNALFVNNIELRFPLFGPNIGGVLFHDIGNVYSTLADISFRYHQRNFQDFNYAVQDAGFGIRYKTPVGPLRVDVAYALNPPGFVGFKGTPLQLLQCGPNAAPIGACQSVQQNTGHFQFFFSIGQTF